MTAPERLSAYLKRTKTTQADFARLVEMTGPMLSMVLSGRRTPGRDASLNIELATGGKVPARLWAKSPANREAA
jgi:transcriptional regulator with XRE-family HTH domain